MNLSRNETEATLQRS